MKKIVLALLVAILTLSCISIAASANKNEDWTGENEFMLASFHTLYNHISRDTLEEAIIWITENAEKNDIKYVSFLGRLSTLSKHTYKSVITQGGGTLDDLVALNRDDTEWSKQFKNLKNSTEFLTETGIPYGVSYDILEIYASGNARTRDSSQSEYFSPSEIVPEGFIYSAYDDANYYTVIENNGTKYIVYQLEIFPRTEVLNWFNETLKKNTDKYAIVYTPSFIDSTGAMYTMWDWEAASYKFSGTTILKGYNLTHVGQPRDGEGIWNYAFSKHDNILAVISTNGGSSEIRATKFKNERGFETAAAVVNTAGIDYNNGPLMLMTKISEDNKTLSFRLFSPTNGYLSSNANEVELSSIATLTEPLVAEGLPHITLQQNGVNKAYIFGYENNTFRPNANMTRAEACTIFARLLLGTQSIPDGYTTRFTDVKEGDWFYNAIAYLDETGFFFRNKNTTYKPNEPITRAEFVDLAYQASSLGDGSADISFSDVPETHFYNASIIAAAGAGIVNGYEDGTFRPDNTITRAEVVTVINRLLSLAVSEDTVVVDKLENVFSDVKGHWAYLNILMASNSNVGTKSSYSATLNGVKSQGAYLVFENKHMKISVNKKTGKVDEIINLANSDNIVADSTNPQFIYLTQPGGTKVSPNALELDGNRIKVTFKTGDVVYLIADIHDNYMAFELDSAIPKAFESVTFANLSTNLEMLNTPESFRLGSMAMTANVFTVYYGMGYSNNTHATVYTKYPAGTIGSKHGFVLSTYEKNDDFLREVSMAVDRSKGLASTKGGPFAREYNENTSDYILISDTSPASLDAIIEKAKEYGINQLDVHHGTKSFRQGDFYFYNTENGTAKEFGETIAKKAEENGISLGLHVYAYYIDYNAKNILSNPKWQQQLECREDEYTLRGDLSKFKSSIKTEEDVTGFDITETFFYRNSRYILIDEEIIYVGLGTEDGFIKCKRAQCGTVAAEHKSGTKIKHLSGYFSRFSPVIGSELFYHMADLTAKAYNDGGFKMLYLDAIDGLGKHTGNTNDTYYYFQQYTHRILSQLHDDPIIEFSSSAPQMWNVRGRMGAWDIPTRGYKAFINNHIQTNLKDEKYNFVTTLGWFSFFPDSDPVAGMRNVIHKTLFRDDIDYMCSMAVAYNMSNVFYSFKPSEVDANPEYKANLEYYKYYNEIRKSKYFSDQTMQRVINHGGEFKIIETSPGEYAFLEMHYNKTNVGNFFENTFTGNNPFDTQEPFIRIESRWSTLSENEITVAEFDESKTLAEQTLTKKISVNMINNMVMKFRVKGTGNDGDAMLISLTGGIIKGESGGRIDYFIDLNFEGWRDVIICDTDSGDYDSEKYKFDGIGTTGMQYSTYRTIPNYEDIVSLTVRTCGEGAGNAQLSTIKAYTQNESPVTNPTITSGASSITFNTTIKGSEYLEYDPAEGKAYVHHADQSVTEVKVTGKLEIPSGDFNATYTGSSSSPIRAKIVLGFKGEQITN